MTRNLILLVLVLGTFTTLIPRSEGNELVTAIASQLISLWKSESVDFLGNSCQYRIRPKIRKFKLKYEGKFWCPGWAPFSGRASASSRSGTVEKAIEDFAQKAVDSNLVTKSDVESWISG
ncbi:UNVERIFIED_CONTAM: hypothetical protein RMT77_013775 [Armadillidium vulgare]